MISFGHWLSTARANSFANVHTIFCVGPRTIGRQHPYAVGLIAAGPVRLLARLLNPLTRLLIVIGNAITPGRGFREGPFSSEVELRELVDMASDRGVVDAGEREMIHSVVELGDTIAREVMAPRTEIIWIEQPESGRRPLALRPKAFGLLAARPPAPGRPRPVLHAFAACGQRSLTCYLGQSVLFVALLPAWTFGLGARLGVAQAALLAVDVPGWEAELPSIATHLDTFGERLPDELRAQ